MDITTVVSIQSEDTHTLLPIIQRFNAACNWLSAVAFEQRLFHWLSLQGRAYRELRERFGMRSDEATVCVRKVAYAYRHKTRRGALAIFSTHGAIPLCRHRYREGQVTLYGVTVSCHARPGVALPTRPPQATLVYRGGRLFIHQVIAVLTPQPFSPLGYLGCDLGVVNILVDSDGTVRSSGHLNGLRQRHTRLRARLQRKGTRSARRLLRKRRRKEQRFARWVNHGISKQVVAKAKMRTWGIALEDLAGIRGRVQVRKAQRRQHHAWSFDQLQRFIQYKAALAGVPVALVDPRHTSQECPACGLIHRGNRPSQAEFRCVRCGYAALADHVAAVNIGRRAASDQPDVAPPGSCESHDGLHGIMR